jgi:methyl-accepting chemotaxis protein
MLADFAYHEPSKEAASFVASPIFDGSKLVGVLIFQLPIDQIDAIMQERSGMGNSGETYLVGNDLLMRSDSRFSEESSIFRQKVDTEAVRSALNGVIGQQVIKDYRGTEVLSAFAPLDIEGMDWVIVAEIDSDEAFSSVQRLTWQMLLIALVAAIVVPVVATWIARSITRPIILLRDVAIALADGDLTQKVRVGARSQDEVSELGSALDAAIATWRGIIGGLRDDSARLSTTAAELASSSEELSRTASVLSDEISRTSTGMEEMATTIREVARSAELAAEASTASSERAHAGGELASGTAVGLEQADEIMQRLRARSDEIGTIVNLIQEIAAQTNILALNAAIEAAGAGAAGARFDVVAEEIRQLAGRTSQATGEIAELIGAVQSDTQVAAEAISKGAAMAQESGASLTNIVEASASVNDMVQSISTSTEEQSRASEEIATSLDAMVGSSQQTATATRETAQIGIELSNLAERLKEAAGRFKV